MSEKPTYEELEKRVLELENAESDRKLSEERIKFFMAASTEAFFLLDSELCLTMINKAGLAISPGNREEDVIGKHILELSPKLEETGRYDRYLNVIETGEPLTFEDIVPDPQFGDIRLTVNASKVGNGLGMVITDITARTQAEEALQDSRNMLQTVLDSIPSAVFWKDRDLIYLGGNRTWLETAGLKSSEEVVGKNDYDLPWEKEQADSFQEDDRRVMESGIPEYGIIEPYLRVDGTRSWAKTNKVPLRDTEGNIISVLGTYEDITEQAQAEEALRESEDLLKATLESTADGILVSDVKGQTINTNKRFAKMWRIPDDLIKLQDDEKLLSYVLDQLVEPTAFLSKAQALYKTTKHDFDTIVFKDGRIFERYSRPLIRADEIAGRVWSFRDVTERKQAEETLRESEEKYRMLFEESPVSLWEEDFSDVKIYFEGLRDSGVKDLRGYFENHPEAVARCAALVKVVDVNKATLDLYEAGSIEEFRDGLGAVFGEDSNDVFREELIALAGGESGFESEAITQTLTGDKNHIALRWSVAQGYEETLSKVLVSVMDLTERKRAEEALKNKHDLMERIIATSPAGITRVDVNGVVVYANKIAEKFLGTEFVEAKGRTYNDTAWKITDFEGRPFPEEKLPFAIVKKTGKPVFNVQHAIEWNDGRRFLLSINAAPFISADGQFDGMVATIEDITERKRAEERLMESDERYRGLFDRSREYVYLHDFEGNFIDANDAALEGLGYTKKDIKSIDFISLLDKDQLPRAIESLEDMIKTGSQKSIEEYRLKRKDGEHIDIESKTAIIYADGKPYAIQGIARDITERKKLDEERSKLIYELRQALEKVKQLGGLLPICSHCKKIRDDKGYWNQIEAYIQDHSDAEFSHGICQECAKKYYPEMDLYDEDETQQ
ncbi:MAG: PAS domain S-box protein [Desulfobacterales bacterium]|nr:PAS domain S-box protein [Desulfobacterales bacterium]